MFAGRHTQDGTEGLRNACNPLRYDSDQRQISLCNINAFSLREVVRIKDMITVNMNSVGR